MAGAEETHDTILKLRDTLVSLLAPDMGTNAIAITDAFCQQVSHYRADRAIDNNLSIGGVATIAPNVTSTHTLDTATAFQLKVTGFKMTLDAAATNIAATNTNTATFNLVYNNGNGGADTVIVSVNTANVAGGIPSGTLAAGIPFSFTPNINATNAVVPSGSCLQIKVTKQGAGGLALPYLSFDVSAKPG